ncbi:MULTISPECIES: hypothetical protein [unclassified Kitasatospora]|uniref:hypothetical protein n=1 Tax=unclassified Kitasatospora TaxID=2633591 RepID=UPI0033D5FE28
MLVDLGMLVMRSGAVVLVEPPWKSAISSTVANLQRGGSLILERLDEDPGALVCPGLDA